MEALLATGVREVEMNNFPDFVDGMDAYRKALFLVRMRGRPIGRVTVDVVHGRVSRSSLEAAFDDAIRWAYNKAQLESVLDRRDARASPERVPCATVPICTSGRP